MSYIEYGIFITLVVVFIGIIIVLYKKINRLQKAITEVEEKNVSVITTNNIRSIKKDIEAIILQNYKYNEILTETFSKYGNVRYNAFGTVGGKLSFSLALLNSTNTGFVLTSLHHEEGSHVFIKEVIKGEAYQDLSEEETEALNKAKQIVVIENLEF